MEISTSLVCRLIETQFPQWSDREIKAVEKDGWDNRTFRLGEDMSVRLPSASRYVAQVEKEQRWLSELAPQLPLPIPSPLARGLPSNGYPWPWSVYRWIGGENAEPENIDNLSLFASDLGRFSEALQAIAPAGGPSPGAHNFYRGGPLTTYEDETRNALAVLKGKIDAARAGAVWEAARKARWKGSPRWLHGDLSAGNLLVSEGRLKAVIDFGSCGVGDPACDTTIAWTLFDGASREAFFNAFPADEAMWARGRGWALWKALITLAAEEDFRSAKAHDSKRVIDRLLADHGRAG